MAILVLMVAEKNSKERNFRIFLNALSYSILKLIQLFIKCWLDFFYNFLRIFLCLREKLNIFINNEILVWGRFSRSLKSLKNPIFRPQPRVLKYYKLLSITFNLVFDHYLFQLISLLQNHSTDSASSSRLLWHWIWVKAKFIYVI